MSNEQNTGRAEAFTATQVAKGSAWSIIGFGGAAIVRMGSSVVLTRVIPDAPSVYGVMALVFSFYGGILLFSDIGVPLLLTQNRRGMEPAFRNTAWTAQVVRGVVLWLTALALAPLFASAYPDYPGLTELIAVTSLAAVIGGFDATALFAFRRNMETHKLAKIGLVSQICGTGFTIAHAYFDPTPWAMVSGALMTSAVKTVIGHCVADRRDRFGWNREAASELMKMGVWVFLSTALTFGCMQADRLVFARLITKEELGLYVVALRLAIAVAEILRHMNGTVLFPVLCRICHAGGDLGATFARHRALIVSSGGLMLTAMCGGGGALMDWLYPDDFAAAGWILQLMAAAAWVDSCLLGPRLQALLALGHPRWTAAANLAKVAAMLTLIPVGYVQYGFLGAVAGYAATELPRYLVALFATYRHGVRNGRGDLLLALTFVSGAAIIANLDSYLLSEQCSALIRALIAGLISSAIWGPHCLRAVQRVRDARADG